MDSDGNELVDKSAYNLPTLFVIDKRGQKRMWKIWVISNTVYRSSGLVSGKKVPWSRTFTGKNKGRKNETTDREQAILEAERAWTKQLDKGYKPNSEGKELYDKVMKEKVKSGGVNQTAAAKIRNTSTANIKSVAGTEAVNLELSIKPMKAETWDLKDPKDPHSVLPRVLKYFDFEKGVYVQWKLDGYRCVARLQEDGNVALTSNGKNQYRWFKNLRKEVQKFLKGKNFLDGLDCELYSHSLVDSSGNAIPASKNFSTIQGICSIGRKTPHPLENQMCLYVFDLVDLSGTVDQKERLRLLKNLFKRSITPHIKFVETETIYSPEEINEWHGKFAEQGYEGIIIRDQGLKYIQKRAKKMMKFKYFIDEEYPIVDALLDPGVDARHFVWVCVLPDGKTFKATPKGVQEEKHEWYANRNEYIGKLLTVKFQEYTDDGVPRFPVGIKFRDNWDL